MTKLMTTIDKRVDGRKVLIDAYPDQAAPDFGDLDKADFMRAAYESGDLIHTIITVTAMDTAGVVMATATAGGYLLWASDLETQVEERAAIDGLLTHN